MASRETCAADGVMSSKKIGAVIGRVSCMAALFGCWGCTSIDDAGLIITNSDLYACADVDYGAVEDGVGQVRAEVVAEVFEHAGGASQQAMIPMRQLGRRDTAMTYGGSEPLTVSRDCVTRLSGDFLFEANPGGELGVTSETRHVETDVSRLVVINVRSAGEFSDPLEVTVSLPCRLETPATVQLGVGSRIHPLGGGDPVLYSATLDAVRLAFAPGVTRRSTSLRVVAEEPSDDFGVIATVTAELNVAGGTADQACSATCVGVSCSTCEEQYRDCGDIGRAYCGMPATSCENWPDGF